METKREWIAEAAKTLSEKRGSIDGLKAEVEKLRKVVEDLEGKLESEYGGKGDDGNEDKNNEPDNENNENGENERKRGGRRRTDLSPERRNKERENRRAARERREGRNTLRKKEGKYCGIEGDLKE